MNIYTYLFVIALVISSIIEYWLLRRQVAHVLSHRHRVPLAFKDSISLEAHQKAADYTLAKGKIARFQILFSALILLGFTVGGGIDLVKGLWSAGDLSILSGTGMLLSVFVLMHVLDLPLTIYQTFFVEERFGFNRTSVRQFSIDQAISISLMVLIGSPLCMAILWTMQNFEAYWWFCAWLILMVFSLLMSWAFPTLIAPLFNKFTPLQDKELESRIQKLLNRCDFTSKGIYIMDGSRRSGHGNAYFTGLGNHKRIVFFDTLLEALEYEEVEAVLAHELGHFKRKHVIKMLCATALTSLLGFAILGWLTGQPEFYSGLGVSQASDAAALLLFALVSPVFTVFLQPVMAYFQRRFEFEADDFASALAKPTALISALVKLYRDNASTLTPDPLYSAFHYSHPPAAIRIAHLQQNSSV